LYLARDLASTGVFKSFRTIWRKTRLEVSYFTGCTTKSTAEISIDACDGKSRWAWPDGERIVPLGRASNHSLLLITQQCEASVWDVSFSIAVRLQKKGAKRILPEVLNFREGLET
jgi:hypothetical protein